MQKIIPKHLILEILANFSIGLVIFSFIIIMGRIFQLTEMMVSQGMSLFHVVMLIGLMLPNFLVFTIPMSLILAIILTFSRASRDYEIIALKASGISIYQIVRPAFLFTLLALTITLYLTIYVAPRNNFNLHKFLVRVISSQVNVALREKVFNDLKGIVIYVDKVSSKSDRLNGILIYDDSNVDTAITIIAQEGYITADESDSFLTITLINGTIILSNKETESEQTSVFERYSLNINIFGNEDDNKKVRKRDFEMTLDELYAEVEWLRGDLVGHTREYKENPEDPTAIFNYEGTLSSIRKRQVEISKRFAFPFACIVFMLIGIPLGIQTNPRGKSGGMFLAIVIIFVYYIFMLLGELFGKNGYINPLYSMWIGNVVLGGAGLYMFIKAGRESPILIITLYNNALTFINKFFQKFTK
jgi:lipopolysaccharide export system permease protein